MPAAALLFLADWSAPSYDVRGGLKNNLKLCEVRFLTLHLFKFSTILENNILRTTSFACNAQLMVFMLRMQVQRSVAKALADL
jgi:hypothetical protein